MARPKKNTDNVASPRPAKAHKSIASTQSLSAFVKSICDVMRRSNCASALQYVPELTWILFLRILDAQEARAREEAEAVGREFFARAAQPLPLAGLGRALFRQTGAPENRRGQTLRLEAAGAVRGGRRQAVRVHQQGTAAAPARPGHRHPHRLA